MKHISTLTEKQEAFLKIIFKLVEKSGRFPLYRELLDETGHKSPTSVIQNLRSLERKGYVKKEDQTWRVTGKSINHIIAGAACPLCGATAKPKEIGIYSANHTGYDSDIVVKCN